MSLFINEGSVLHKTKRSEAFEVTLRKLGRTVEYDAV